MQNKSLQADNDLSPGSKAEQSNLNRDQQNILEPGLSLQNPGLEEGSQPISPKDSSKLALTTKSKIEAIREENPHVMKNEEIAREQLDQKECPQESFQECPQGSFQENLQGSLQENLQGSLQEGGPQTELQLRPLEDSKIGLQEGPQEVYQDVCLQEGSHLRGLQDNLQGIVSGIDNNKNQEQNQEQNQDNKDKEKQENKEEQEKQEKEQNEQKQENKEEKEQQKEKEQEYEDQNYQQYQQQNQQQEEQDEEQGTYTGSININTVKNQEYDGGNQWIQGIYQFPGVNPHLAAQQNILAVNNQSQSYLGNFDNNIFNNQKNQFPQSSQSPQVVQDAKGTQAAAGKQYSVFIGGIPLKCEKEQLHDYFIQFGPIKEIEIVQKKNNKQPLGFAFLTFENEESTKKATSMKHRLFDRIIDVNPFRSKLGIKTQHQCTRQKKIFVSQIGPDYDKDDLEECFAQFGQVLKGYVMYHHKTKKSREFGFVEFLSEEGANNAIKARSVQYRDRTFKVTRVQLKGEENQAQQKQNQNQNQNQNQPQVQNQQRGFNNAGNFNQRHNNEDFNGVNGFYDHEGQSFQQQHYQQGPGPQGMGMGNQGFFGPNNGQFQYSSNNKGQNAMGNANMQSQQQVSHQQQQFNLQNAMNGSTQFQNQFLSQNQQGRPGQQGQQRQQTPKNPQNQFLPSLETQQNRQYQHQQPGFQGAKNLQNSYQGDQDQEQYSLYPGQQQHQNSMNQINPMNTMQNQNQNQNISQSHIQSQNQSFQQAEYHSKNGVDTSSRQSPQTPQQAQLQMLQQQKKNSNSHKQNSLEDSTKLSSFSDKKQQQNMQNQLAQYNLWSQHSFFPQQSPVNSQIAQNTQNTQNAMPHQIQQQIQQPQLNQKTLHQVPQQPDISLLHQPLSQQQQQQFQKRTSINSQQSRQNSFIPPPAQYDYPKPYPNRGAPQPMMQGPQQTYSYQGPNQHYYPMGYPQFSPQDPQGVYQRGFHQAHPGYCSCLECFKKKQANETRSVQMQFGSDGNELLHKTANFSVGHQPLQQQLSMQGIGFSKAQGIKESLGQTGGVQAIGGVKGTKSRQLLVQEQQILNDKAKVEQNQGNGQGKKRINFKKID